MFARRIRTSIPLLPRISLRQSPFKQSNVERKYTTLAHAAPQRDPDPSETLANLRILRAQEHRIRKFIIKGIIMGTIVAYYLDGKYNARAVRRTLRTAWVGATLAADYKWNFRLDVGLLCIH